MSRNYLLSWSAPPGTAITELNAAYKSVAAAAPSHPAPSQSGTAAADWPTYNRTLTSERYSQLSEINTDNAAKLKVLCTYDVDEYTAFESGLIMVENALIGTTEFDIFSLDPATCAENWRTHEDYPPALLPSNRGAAYLDGMLFRGTQDGRVLGYDFKTGKRLWETTIADPKRGESVPSAPIAADGVVYVGNAGGDFKGGQGAHVRPGCQDRQDRLGVLPGSQGRGRHRPWTVGSDAARRIEVEECAGYPDQRWRNLDVLHARHRKPGCSTSPAAIQPPISSRACARETTPSPTPSSCSMPRPGTTKIISRL